MEESDKLALIKNPIFYIVKFYLNWINRNRIKNLKMKYTKLLNNQLSVDEINYEELIEINDERVDELFKIHTNEEEAIKLEIYKRIYKLIKNKSINKKDYSKYMRIIKNLPSEALSLLPKIYVYITTDKRTRMPLGNFLNSIENNEPYLCNCLMNEALLNKEPCMGGYNIIATDLIKEVAKQFFPKEELTIEKQNIKIWKCKFHIMNNGDFDNEQAEISRLLEKIDIQTFQGFTYATNLKNLLIINLCIIFKNIKVENSLIEKLRQLPQRINIIKITFHGNTVDPIPEIGTKLIYIDLKDENSKNDFINSFLIQ